MPAGGPWPEDYIEGASAEVCYVCWFVLQKADKVFADVEAFYAADERRRYSGEAAYGAHWRATGSREQWRVSYVQATGEIYAVRHATRIVLVLGTLPADDEAGGLYYRTLEDILDGWPARCGAPGGLQWVAVTLEVSAGVG